MPDTSTDQHVASVGQIRLLALLEDGLDTLELGVGLFDTNLQLVDCNRLFRKIRGYPAGLCQLGPHLSNCSGTTCYVGSSTIADTKIRSRAGWIWPPSSNGMLLKPNSTMDASLPWR